MTRKYSLVIEGDCDGYSAYVPELPSATGDVAST
jgi:predicted RNase H-like HicB family nuclease